MIFQFVDDAPSLSEFRLDYRETLQVTLHDGNAVFQGSKQLGRGGYDRRIFLAVSGADRRSCCLGCDHSLMIAGVAGVPRAGGV